MLAVFQHRQHPNHGTNANRPMADQNHIPAVYQIRNVISGKLYVGSALNIVKRWRLHRSDLTKGIHHCEHLQRSYTKHGAEAFVFEVLERVALKGELTAREQFYMDCLSAVGLYNTAPKAGSTLGAGGWTNPRSAITRAKISATLKAMFKARGFPEATRAAAIAANTGRKDSAKTRATKSAKMLGNTRRRDSVSVVTPATLRLRAYRLRRGLPGGVPP
jgi:group I intron endonuclease